MKTCLIIGVDSFTGKYISETFNNQGCYNVIGTARSFCHGSITGVSKIYKMDLLDYDEVNNVIKSTSPDIIIHLAGISFAANEDIAQYYNVHVVGTRNILKSVDENRLPVLKIILASTGQVYGHASGITESSSVNPLNDYAISKLAMEYTAKIWIDRLPIIIARPFNYVGIGQKKFFVVPKIINAFVTKAKELSLGRIDIKRDFSDVRYIAQCYLSLAEKGVVGETYNLASGRSLSINYLIETLSKLADSEMSIVQDKRFIRANDPDLITVNNDKIAALTSPTDAIDMEVTLEWIYSHESRH